MENKLEVSTLILRVILGITFFVHGYVKFAGGIENTVAWFSSIGLPGPLAYVVAIIELVGGFALIIGLGSKIVSALLGIIMIGATLTAKLSGGFLGNGAGAGWELDLALLAMAVVIVINGSKLLSVDSLFSKNQDTVSENI
ncbi:DoxX family protein [Niallia sp. XMNu-256]|uniref:DoxX family protein n=1 Tax=Niallia sp. XMNu-256 TaxID=3082444 RepID=UPI0030D3553A